MTDIGNLAAVDAVGNPESVPGKLSLGARRLIEQATDEAPLVGFVTVGIYGNGCFALGFKTPDDHPFMGGTMFTAYVKEIIAREMTGQMAAEDYIREHLL